MLWNVIGMTIGIGNFTIGVITFARKPNWISAFNIYLGALLFMLYLLTALGVLTKGEIS